MTELTNPYLQIKETNLVDNSITEFEYVEYLPRDSNNMNKDGQHIIETKDEDVFLLPHKAYLEIRGKLQTNANANYNNNDVISLVNNGWSLFQTAQYQLNNQTTENINLYLPQASTILNLVSFSDDYSRSTASNMLWFKDTGTGSPSLKQNFGGVADDANANAVRDGIRAIVEIYNNNLQANIGFTARQNITTGNKQITLMLPLSQIFGFCRDIDKVFRGVKHSIVVDRETSNNYILRANGVAAGKFNISHISLWMLKVKPSLRVESEIDAMLLKGHIKQLYFEQMRVYRTMFQSTETSMTWRITTQPGTELPRHVFVAFQSSERDNNQQLNNMIFDNANLRRISCRINSIQYPEREFECNFTPQNRNYSRLYMSFLEAVNKYQDADTGCQLSAEDWASLYPIHHFDVSKHNERLKNSSADIEIRFSLGGNFRNIANNADQAFYVYAVVLSDRYLQLEGLSGRMNIII